VRIERHHEKEGDVDTVCFVKVFNLVYGEIEKRHSALDFQGTLRQTCLFPYFVIHFHCVNV